MFLERIVFSHVKNRLQWYIDDPRRFESFLLSGGLDEEEAASAKENFTEYPPALLHGFARQGGVFPCYALVLGNESTAQDYLGENALPIDEDGNEYIDPDTGERIDIHVRRWEHRLDWYVYANHPDQALYNYYLLRHIMVGLRSRLQEEHLDEILFNGAELAPDPRYLPSDIFTRRFSMNFRSDEDYVEDYRPGVGQGTQIRGLAIQDSGEIPEELTDEEQDELANATFGITTYLED
jgi:hypothetical protein